MPFSGLGWEEESFVRSQARFRLEMITGWLLRGLCVMIIALGPFPGLPASCHRSSFVWTLVHVLVGWWLWVKLECKFLAAAGGFSFSFCKGRMEVHSSDVHGNL